MSSTAENMTFLDSNAQTFLGVILTLTVLCLFASNDGKDGGDGNFIFRLLTQQWEKFEMSLMSLFNAVAEKLSNFQKSKEYQTLSNDVYDDKGDAELYIFGLKVLLSFKNATNDIKSDSSPLIFGLDRIKKSNEQFRAPFFTLMFGIVMLSFSMIASWCDADAKSLIMPGIWLFALLSIIYWIALWTAFLCHNMGDKKKSKSKGVRFWKRIDDRFSWHKGSLYKIGLCAGVAFLVLWVVDVTMFSSSMSFAIVILLLLLIITVIGVFRVISCEIKGNYSAIHTIGHLAAFLLYSVALCVIYDIWGAHACDSLFQNDELLAGVIVFFALVNGIICPFALPYLKYRSPSQKTMDKLKGWDKNLDNAIADFNEGFKEWTAKYYFVRKKAEEAQTTTSGDNPVIYKDTPPE